MRIIILLAGLLFYFSGFGQKEIDNQFNAWYTYTGNHNLANKWRLHTKYSFRRNGFIENWQQSLARVGVNYKAHEKVALMGGYDWAVNYPYGKQPNSGTFVEHRSFEQIALRSKIGLFGLTHFYRLEQRYTAGNSVKNRIRIKLNMVVALAKKSKENKQLFLSIYNELFINFGKSADTHYFDQNWVGFKFSYEIKKNLKVEWGYMNQFLMKSNEIQVESNHTLKLGVVYSIDFRKMGKKDKGE